MQSISIESILTKIRNALLADVAISDFCQVHYAKDPTLYIGFDVRNAPSDAQCPAIIVFPGVKVEGEEIDEWQYEVTVSWSIVNASKITTNGAVEFAGVYESSQLGQLIYNCLAEVSANSPITRAEVNIDTITSHPQFPGRMDITFTIPVVIGGDISF